MTSKMKAKGFIILGSVTALVGVAVFMALKKNNSQLKPNPEPVTKKDDGSIVTSTGKTLVPKGGVISTNNIKEVITGLYQKPEINVQASINNMLSAPTSRENKVDYFKDLATLNYISAEKYQELISKI